MKVNYTTKNGRLSVELEADSQKALWAQLGAFQETFEESACGKCGSDDVLEGGGKEDNHCNSCKHEWTHQPPEAWWWLARK